VKFAWRVPLLLLAGACSSGAPAAKPSNPSPVPTRPGEQPSPLQPSHEVVLNYPRTGAGISHYAFTRRDSVVATMPSGEEQVQILARTAYLTLTWVAADSGTRITTAIDSLVADSGLTLPMVALDSARGTRWTALRPPGGGLTGIAGNRNSLLGDQVRDQLVLLFPRLPADGLRPGTRWTDSTQTAARVSAFEAEEISLTNSDAGPQLASGVVPIQVTISRSATGEASQFGQPMSVKATGSDTLDYQFGSDGKILEVSGHRWTSLVVEISSIGQKVPANEISSVSMKLLR
jgi:hypothetical protein